MSTALQKVPSLDVEKWKSILNESYHEVVKKDGLKNFIIRVERRESITLNEIRALFDKSLWVNAKKTGGHKKYEHLLTRIVVEFSNHAEPNTGTLKTIRDAVQEHVNILGNEIFGYTRNNWKSPPDLDKALKNFIPLLKL